MNCLWDTVEQFVVEQRSGEVPWRTGLPQALQCGPGLVSMSPARRSRREAVAGGGPPFGEKVGRGRPSLWPVGGTEPWGACLVGCIGSFREKVVGVAAKRLQP